MNLKTKPQQGIPYIPADSSDKKNTNSPIKGTFMLSFASRSASMTVEAAIALPLFLFFFLNILWIISMYSLHGTLLSALRETGYKMCVYGYAYDAITREEDDEGVEALAENIAFSYLYVKQQVEAYAGKEELNRSPLINGASGIAYVESSIMQQGDIIDLVAQYRVSSLVPLISYRPALFYCRFYGRAFTGYAVGGDTEKEEEPAETYVYVTENASVYHRNRDCSHIRLSVRTCTGAELAGLRNEYGNSYAACEFCAENTEGILYIASAGDCYHQDIHCRGLTRNVSRVALSEVADTLPPCSRCGGQSD